MNKYIDQANTIVNKDIVNRNKVMNIEEILLIYFLSEITNIKLQKFIT